MVKDSNLSLRPESTTLGVENGGIRRLCAKIWNLGFEPRTPVHHRLTGNINGTDPLAQQEQIGMNANLTPTTFENPHILTWPAFTKQNIDELLIMFSIALIRYN